MNRLIVMTGLFLLASDSMMYAQKTTARFLLWQPSATSQSMGGLGVALHENAFAAHYNPAALAGVKGVSAAGSFVRPYPFFGSTGHSFAGLAVHVPDLGTLALSSNFYWMGATDIVSITDVMLGRDEQDHHWHGKMSFATEFRPGMSLGVSIGHFSYDMDFAGNSAQSANVEASVLTLDAGLLATGLFKQLTYEPTEDRAIPRIVQQLAEPSDEPGLTLGMALRNWTTEEVALVDDDQADPMPVTWSAGVLARPLISDFISLSAGVDAEKEMNEKGLLHLMHWGAEAMCLRVLGLRVGYVQDVYGPKTSYATWGLGFVTRYGSINVARYRRVYAQSWHVDATIHWIFGE